MDARRKNDILLFTVEEKNSMSKGVWRSLYDKYRDELEKMEEAKTWDRVIELSPKLRAAAQANDEEYISDDARMEAEDLIARKLEEVPKPWGKAEKEGKVKA
jgi:hypothetical protein